MAIGIIITAVMILIVAGIAFFIIRKKKDQETSFTVQEPIPVPRRRSHRDGLKVMTGVLKTMAGNDYRCFEQIYIPTEKGKPVKVDALMIGVNGLFVFRFISLEGWILGNEDSRWWTHFVSTDERHYLNNPVWEMDQLLEQFKAFLPKTKSRDYRAYVVFSNKCELRSVNVTGDTGVINLRQLTSLLETDLMTAPVVYDREMVDAMARVFEVLDDPLRLEERLVQLQKEMDEDRLETVRQKAAEQRAVLAEKAMAEPDPEEQKRLREMRHIQKYRPEERFTRAELGLRDALILWRKQQAEAQGISVVEVFDNRVLDSIVVLKPKAVSVLNQIQWLDEEKIVAYGQQIVTMVKHAPVE